MDYNKEYERWLQSPALTEDEKNELSAIKGNEGEIESRFFAPLSFGTAGLRGVLGVGLNRMNRFTVGQAAQGLANLVVQNGKEAAERGVAIAHDCRNGSVELSRLCATILAASGIKVLIFDELRPTPELSFAIRHYGCIAGINITASHNPREYNGFKVYWQDGAQMPPKEADVVAAEMAKLDVLTGAKTTDFDKALEAGLIRWLGAETDELYLQKIQAMAVNPACVAEVADEFKIVYTPFHGAGYRLVPEILKRIGYKHVICVPEQMVIDGNFPTVESPNPEYKEGFTLAIKLAKQNDVDLIIGTDPDSDRTGLVVKDDKGEYVTLSGNQVGVLLIDYILTGHKRAGTLPAHPAVLKSIVSTEMARVVAEQNGAACFETFTGFKFLAEKVKQLEQGGKYEYMIAYEESYGYMAGDYCRDKDAVTASMLVAEMAAYYRTQSMTLYQAMQSMYEKYGHYAEHTLQITMPGVSGLARMRELMDEIRKNPMREIAGQEVFYVRDYLPGTRTCLADGKVEKMELSTQNVMYFELAGGTVFIIRPSGTEPKVKVYIMAKADTQKAASDKVESLIAAAKEIVK